MSPERKETSMTQVARVTISTTAQQRRVGAETGMAPGECQHWHLASPTAMGSLLLLAQGASTHPWLPLTGTLGSCLDPSFRCLPHTGGYKVVTLGSSRSLRYFLGKADPRNQPCWANLGSNLYFLFLLGHTLESSPRMSRVSIQHSAHP